MKTKAIVMAAMVAAGMASAQSAGTPGTFRMPAHDAWMKETEFAGEFVFRAPGLGDFDVFDMAYGVDLTYRHWFTDILGAGVGLGFETWTVQNHSRNWIGALDGDMLVIPLTVSGFLRVAEFGWGTLIGFAGAQYAFSDSDITMTRDGESETVDADGSFVGRIGAELSIPMDGAISLGFRIGYQASLMGGDAEAFGDTNLEVDLEAVFFGLGLSVAF